jgi:two-component system phosphate regulon sensor histidine kinase PhoR
VASVSHELKTPLALIHGYIEALHSNRVRTPEQGDDYFRIVNSEALRLSAMVDRILDSSKIEAGIKSYQPELVDVTAIVEETVAHFAYELEKASVTLSRETPEARLLARVDPESLSQAIMNLLGNAVKYSGKDRRITLRVAREGDRIAIAVSDHGIGIRCEEQHRIFQKFYRVTTGANGQQGGAGLGLALVKHFAEAHGGAVTVESEPGQGSTFTILLPCATGIPAGVAENLCPENR